MLQKWAAVFYRDAPDTNVTVRFDTPYVRTSLLRLDVQLLSLNQTMAGQSEVSNVFPKQR
jgi:hypothetical protein